MSITTKVIEIIKTIPKNDYKKIVSCMPVFCVDVIIIRDGNYLLVERGNEPKKREFWIPGGRLFKGESIKNCALRKAKEEIGLDCKFIKMCGIFEDRYEKSPFGVSVHNISAVCLLKDTRKKEVKLDKDHIGFVWTKKIMKNLDPGIRKFLKEVGFKQ